MNESEPMLHSDGIQEWQWCV